MNSFQLILSLLCVWNYAQTENKNTEAVTDDINDYTGSVIKDKDMQIMSKWNDLLQIKMVILQKDLDRQIEMLSHLEQKVMSMPQKFEEILQRYIKKINFDKYTEGLKNAFLAKLSHIEDNIVPITDQLKFYSDIQQCCNKIDANEEVCHKQDNKIKQQNLTGSSQTSVRSCTDCADDKCLIQNDLYSTEPFVVACNNSVDGGGWIVIQRRINGSVDFNRGWYEYKTGFGNTDGEFFIGLDKLHALTTTLEPVELLIQLQDFDNVMKYAKYDDFQVGSETEGYELIKLGAYSGNAGDSFSYHVGSYFSTEDHDNDAAYKFNCARSYLGGWWYKHCYRCNLNGRYYQASYEVLNGIIWGEFYDSKYTTLKFVQMLIRPRKL